MNENQYAVIGRVESRPDGTIRLLDSDVIVRVNECPCDDGKIVLIEKHGEEFQPVAWET